MAQQSSSMWANKLAESLSKSLKKQGAKDKLHDNMLKRLNAEHHRITQGFNVIVQQIQKESSGDTWGVAAEIAGAVFGE